MQKIILYIIPSFCLIAFSGVDLFWHNAFYDGLRVYQLIALFLFSIYAAIFSTKFKIKLIIIFSLIALLTLNYQISLAINAFYSMALVSSIVLLDSFKNNEDLVEKITFLIALMPCFTVFYIFPSLYLRMKGIDINWYQSFENYRMLDDALLPCIFLIWYWQSRIENKKLKFLLLFINIIYILSLYFNGARAVLLALILANLIILIINFKERKYFLPVFISITVATTFFLIIRYILNSNVGSPLIRGGTSGRVELWVKSYHTWLKEPLFGIGGNNYVHYTPDLLSAHPHNYILMLISEYGILGFFFVCLSLLFMFKLVVNKNHINLLLQAMVLAIFFNAMLSGSFVYPLTQMINLWCLVFVARKLHCSTIIEHQKTYNFVFRVLVLIATFISIEYFIEDILCYDCSNYSGYVAPGFWLDGKILHLSQ